jgi:dTDP-glucose 4,6-dehydratase
MSFYSSFDTPVVTLRPFNTYGPRQSARAVIPTIITQIASGERRIKLGALHPTRDFSFVEDTVSGFIAAMNCPAAVGQVINLGSNFEISIGDTTQCIADVMGAEIEIVTDDVRMRPSKSEVERLFANNTKAREILGWAPAYGSHDGFMRGLAKTVEWFTDPANLATYKTGIYNI